MYLQRQNSTCSYVLPLGIFHKVKNSVIYNKGMQQIFITVNKLLMKPLKTKQSNYPFTGNEYIKLIIKMRLSNTGSPPLTKLS